MIPATIRRLDRRAVILALVALAAYAPGFWWGAPTATAADRVLAWGVDDRAPLGALAELHNIVHPRADRNLGYPLLHDFAVAAVYAPYLVTLKATGRLGQTSATYPFGLADPVRTLRALTLLDHALSVLLGVIVVVAGYQAARVLWGPATGVVAGAFALTLYPMFYYARTGNVDVPVLACLALAIAALAHALARGMTTGRAAWIGIFSGMALATKEQAVGLLLPAALIVLVQGWRTGGWRVPAWSLLAAFLALGAGSGLFIEPSRWIAHVRFIAGRVEAAPTAATLTYAFPFTFAGNLDFAGKIVGLLADTMSVPGLVLATAGMVVASWRDRRALLLALAVPSYLLMVFLFMRSAQLRYVLPAAWALALFAGWAAVTAWRSAHRGLRGLTVAFAAGALALQLVYGASLTWEMLRDSRYAAGRWIAARVRPGDRVDFFGASNKLPPIPAAVTTDMATTFYGMWTVHRANDAVADEVRARWRERPPALVVVIPDHSSRPGLPYDASMPPMLFASLEAGTEQVRPAAFFQTPPLVPFLRRPSLDYPTVNPPIRIYAPEARSMP